MEFILHRWTSDAEQTFGVMRDFKKLFKCHTLEDEYREVKVPGETRIPAGRYKLGIRHQDTDLTVKHRLSYNKDYLTPWFKFHIEILNVKNFSGIYIHSGNDQKHTDGCILLGDVLDVTKSEKPLTPSTPAVKRFYDLVYPLIDNGVEEVWLTIKDEIDLF